MLDGLSGYGSPQQRLQDQNSDRRRALVRDVVVRRILPELLRRKDVGHFDQWSEPAPGFGESGVIWRGPELSREEDGKDER